MEEGNAGEEYRGEQHPKQPGTESGGFGVKALGQQSHQRLGKYHAQKAHGGGEEAHPGKEAAGEPECVLLAVLLHPLGEHGDKAGGDGGGKNRVEKRSGNPAGGEKRSAFHSGAEVVAQKHIPHQTQHLAQHGDAHNQAHRFYMIFLVIQMIFSLS